jgi:hypothetical protein
MTVEILASQFPPLEPLTRSYSFGVFPLTNESAFPGGGIRFLHGSVSSGHQLELGYQYLSETEAGYIRRHYRLNQGGYKSFVLSTEAWAGHTSMTDLVPTTTRWKYAAPPQETHRSAGLTDVTVSLVSVI